MSNPRHAIACIAPRIPIAQMRSVFSVAEVERKLAKLPEREHESLRGTYQRMLEKGPQRFQVKPSGLPAMNELYEDLPNFHPVLDDVRRQIALCEDSGDALEITPVLLLGPPGVGKTHFARQLAQLLGTGMGFVSMSSMTAGWILSGASSQWKGARPGKVFEALVDGDYANPVMVVDEIDKAGAEAAYDPLGSLYSLLEHDTAGCFTDEFAEVAVDASQLIWVATANDARGIPDPILNRVNVYEIEAPDFEAARRIAQRPGPARPARLGPALRRGTLGRGAAAHGRTGPARDAPRLDDGLRQCQAGAARHGAVRGPARGGGQARSHGLHPVAASMMGAYAHLPGRPPGGGDFLARPL